VRVVAVGTLYRSLVNPMLEKHRELRPDVGVTSPEPVCAERPGPWQPSQPVWSGVSAADATLLKWGFLKKVGATPGWHVLQVLLPIKAVFLQPQRVDGRTPHQ